MQDNWNKIQELVVDDSMNQIHVDTRDFHYISNDEMLDTRDGREPLIRRYAKNKHYTIDGSQIKELLMVIYENACKYKPIDGGNFTIMFNPTKNLKKSYWLKYIRMDRMKDGRFIVCNGEKEPIEVDKLKIIDYCHDMEYYYQNKIIKI